MDIDTGDHVHHEPSGEDWVVAYVRGDRLAWCGWPGGQAALADCRLLRKANDDDRLKLLVDMAAISGEVSSTRQAGMNSKLESLMPKSKFSLVSSMRSDAGSNATGMRTTNLAR